MLPGFSTRRQWCAVASGALLSMLPGCGTILYPERKGQPAGCIDWKIVALDGLGLLFFFIPGVIAFAVDFNNGTIYLPPGECVDRSRPQKKQLTAKRIPRGKLSRPGLEAIVAEHTGQTIDLDAGRYETRSLESVDDFWPTHDEFAPPA
jgi:hypothetical protein